MNETFYLVDRASVADAAALIDRHGVGAKREAAARARRSRSLGNHIHFCRWRQIERLVALLGAEEARGTVQ